MINRFSLAGAFFLGTVWTTGRVAAQPAGKVVVPLPPANQLDQKLLNDLPPTPPAKSPPAPDRRPPSSSAGEDVGRASSVESRLADIGRRMRHVETLLRERGTSPEARQLQAEIARDLARLISERQGSGTQSNSRQSATSQQSPSKPGDAASPRTPPKQTGDKGDPSHAATRSETDQDVRQTVQSVWGDLPDRVRQQIQQPVGEEFLPEFKDLIREYYRSLVERASKQR